MSDNDQEASHGDGPLLGTLVVSVEQAVAAPLCSARLADAGAEVVKVERPGGDFARHYDDLVDGESAYFIWLNRGKKSVVLDFKSGADYALLRRMIDRADVFIQNLAPGAAERAGLSPKLLRSENPRLITCSISGYGESGPYAAMKAYDLLIQCESGLASITGTPEAPGRVGVSACDLACGLYANAAILEALLERKATERGQHLEVSLFSAMAEWMTVPLLHYEYGGKGPSRVGLNHPSIAPYGVYADRDGQQVMIAIQNEREWRRLCTEVLGDQNLVDDDRFHDNLRRVKYRSELDEVIQRSFRKRSPEELRATLVSASIAHGTVNEVADLARHPQLRRAEVKTPSGTARLVAPPVLGSTGTARLGAVPALGEDNAEIRARFGSSSSSEFRGPQDGDARGRET